MREREGYREMIAELQNDYPGQLMFSVKEVSKICGICEQTVRKRIPIQPDIHRISRHNLARFMAGR